MKVFISGSISMKQLRENDIPPLEQIVEGNRTILIGDAYGADKAVQQFLLEQNYQKVTVYFVGNKPRNNLGNWNTKQIENPENLTGKSRYQLKEKAMADECDSAIMFWDDKSRGTQDNMKYMDKLDKYYLVCGMNYLSAGNMHHINNMVML